MTKIKKFRDYEDSDDIYESREDRRHKLNEKRLKAALKSRNYDQLIDLEDDYI